MNAVVEKTKNQIVEFNEFELQLQEFKEKYDNVVYDLNVPEQEKQARSDRHSIGKVLSKLDSVHKALKAPLKEQVDLIDGRRKEIKDQLLEVQGKIKGQIEAHEKEIEEHAEMLQANIDLIRSHAEFEDGESFDSIELKKRLDNLKALDINDFYEDRKADATLAQVETVKKLENLLAERIKYEDEQAELEKLRQEKEERERADREEKIRQEAEAKAKREAEEKAGLEKQEAAAEAQRKIDDAQQKQEEAEIAARRAKEEKKLAAETAAREEREKIERERKEKERKEQEKREKEDAKKAKTAHRNRVQGEAASSLGLILKIGVSPMEIIEAIDNDEIDHISINY